MAPVYYQATVNSDKHITSDQLCAYFNMKGAELNQPFSHCLQQHQTSGRKLAFSIKTARRQSSTRTYSLKTLLAPLIYMGVIAH